MDQQHNNDSTSEKQLVEHRNIPDTPFEAVRIDDKWFLTLGKYRLTETMQSFEQVQEDAYNTTWMRIMQIVQIMIDEDREKHSLKSNNN